MSLARILKDSLELLVRQPKAYAPRIFMTVVYTAYILGTMDLTAEFMQMTEASQVASFMWRLAMLFVMVPLLYLADLISYAMYPTIVADHRRGAPISLMRSLKAAIAAWRVILLTGLIIFGSLLLVSGIAVSAEFATMMTGQQAFRVFGGLASLILILAFSIAVFFVVPSAVISGNGMRQAMKESMSLGLKNKWDLLRLNLMFVAIVLATMVLVLNAKLNSEYALPSVALFVAARLLQALVYTYMSVTNPMYYEQVRVK